MVNTWDGVGRKRLYQVTVAKVEAERGEANVFAPDALQNNSSLSAFYHLPPSVPPVSDQHCSSRL